MNWNSIYELKPINGTAAAVAKKNRKKCAPKVSKYAELRAARALERSKWTRENARYWK